MFLTGSAARKHSSQPRVCPLGARGGCVPDFWEGPPAERHACRPPYSALPERSANPRCPSEKFFSNSSSPNPGTPSTPQGEGIEGVRPGSARRPGRCRTTGPESPAPGPTGPGAFPGPARGRRKITRNSTAKIRTVSQGPLGSKNGMERPPLSQGPGESSQPQGFHLPQQIGVLGPQGTDLIEIVLQQVPVRHLAKPRPGGAGPGWSPPGGGAEPGPGRGVGVPWNPSLEGVSFR